MKAQQQSLLFLHSAVLLFGGTALFSKLIGLPALDITHCFVYIINYAKEKN